MQKVHDSPAGRCAAAIMSIMDRIGRALSLDVIVMGPGVYYVTGGEEPHWVNLADPMVPPCDCGDHTFRERTCAHIVAARMARGDSVRDVHAAMRQEEAARV